MPGSLLIICKDFLGQHSNVRLHRISKPLSVIEHFYDPSRLLEKSIRNSTRPLTVLIDLFMPCDSKHKNH